jgi:hypothetical protein
MTNIIAIVSPEHLHRWGSGFGIPTDFWVANKEAFPEGTPPTLLYQDHGDLTAITISDNPRLVAGSEYHETAMLFKLVRRTVLRLKGDLLRIWEGEDHEKILIGNDKLLFCRQMTGEQRLILNRLNARLLGVEKSLHERVAQLSKEYPGQCLACRIHFILNENDPEWADEDDNIMAILNHHHRDEYDPSANWNDCPHLIKNENGEPAHLCWLYHELYDHTGLAWEDLLRVGQIRVTIKVNFDHDF